MLTITGLSKTYGNGVKALNNIDRGSFAAHYGSTSLVTFSAGILFLESNSIFVEGFAPADPLDGDAGRKKALDGFRQTQRLIFHAGPAVRDDPDRERGLVGPYFHSTLRIS